MWGSHNHSFSSLKGISIISNVGTYLAFLSHTDVFILPRPASCMSQLLYKLAGRPYITFLSVSSSIAQVHFLFQLDA